jgi:hypothetical protein
MTQLDDLCSLGLRSWYGSKIVGRAAELLDLTLEIIDQVVSDIAG